MEPKHNLNHQTELLQLIDDFCSKHPAAQIEHTLCTCFIRTIKTIPPADRVEIEKLGTLLEELYEFYAAVYRLHTLNKKLLQQGNNVNQ